MTKFKSLGHMFRELVPTYKGRSWRPFNVSFGWDPRVAKFMKNVSPIRYEKRRQTYLIPGELDRAKRIDKIVKSLAIRFGNKKDGHGFYGSRGDFCLIGGALVRKQLTLFYRRLDLIGGLHYDLAIVAEVDRVLGPINSVQIMAVQADTSAFDGGSNQKLYKVLTDYYATT